MKKGCQSSAQQWTYQTPQLRFYLFDFNIDWLQETSNIFIWHETLTVRVPKKNVVLKKDKKRAEQLSPCPSLSAHTHTHITHTHTIILQKQLPWLHVLPSLGRQLDSKCELWIGNDQVWVKIEIWEYTALPYPLRGELGEVKQE